VIHLSSETGDLFAQAFAFAQKQVRKLTEKHPGFYPLYTQNGLWKHEGPAWTHWCDGFMPGMMWMFQKHAAPDSPESKFCWTRPSSIRSRWSPARTIATCTT